MSFTPINSVKRVRTTNLQQGIQISDQTANREQHAKRRNTSAAAYLGEKGEERVTSNLERVLHSELAKPRIGKSSGTKAKTNLLRSTAKASHASHNAQLQRRVSDGFHITKPAIDVAKETANVKQELTCQQLVTPLETGLGEQCHTEEQRAILSRLMHAQRDDEERSLSSALLAVDAQGVGSRHGDHYDVTALISPVTTMDIMKSQQSQKYSSTASYSVNHLTVAKQQSSLHSCESDRSGRSALVGAEDFISSYRTLRRRTDHEIEEGENISSGPCDMTVDSFEDSDLDDFCVEDFDSIIDLNPLGNVAPNNQPILPSIHRSSTSDEPSTRPVQDVLLPLSTSSASYHEAACLDTDRQADTLMLKPDPGPCESASRSTISDDAIFDDADGVFDAIDTRALIGNDAVIQNIEHTTPVNGLQVQFSSLTRATGTGASVTCNKSAMFDVQAAPATPHQPAPIIRPPFPAPVRDRSPVIGLSSDSVLRTCFRIGEALNVGSLGARNNVPIVIELYARVKESSRNSGVSQRFTFSDLYHDHRPYLNAHYDTWKGAELWDYDSKRFLTNGDTPNGRICRCIGRIKREQNEWRLLVLNIWEATWEDIVHVQNIVCC